MVGGLFRLAVWLGGGSYLARFGSDYPMGCGDDRSPLQAVPQAVMAGLLGLYAFLMLAALGGGIRM